MEMEREDQKIQRQAGEMPSNRHCRATGQIGEACWRRQSKNGRSSQISW